MTFNLLSKLFVSCKTLGYYEMKEQAVMNKKTGRYRCSGDKDCDGDGRFSDAQLGEEVFGVVEEDQFYKRPGKIVNKALVAYMGMEETPREIGKTSTVDFQIQDMYDYVKVDQRCWDYLKKWYDYDYEIKVKNSNIEEIYKSLNTESNEY